VWNGKTLPTGRRVSRTAKVDDSIRAAPAPAGRRLSRVDAAQALATVLP
jgi:hypothetical protein